MFDQNDIPIVYISSIEDSISVINNAEKEEAKNQEIDTLKLIYESISEIGKISLSLFVLIGLTFFILRFFSFVTLISFYYYLDLAFPTSSYYFIF